MCVYTSFHQCVCVCVAQYVHAGHQAVLLPLVQQPVDGVELQQGLGHGRRLRLIGQEVQEVEDLKEGHAAQSVDKTGEKGGAF